MSVTPESARPRKRGPKGGAVHLRDRRHPEWTDCGRFRGVYRFAERAEDVTCGLCVRRLTKRTFDD